MKKGIRGQRGQGLVEFAVIFPIFAFFLFAVIDGGLLMSRYNNVTNSAKEGARLGAVGANQSAIVDRVKQQMHGILDSGLSTSCADMTNPAKSKVVCVEWITGPPPGNIVAGQTGSTVRVKVKYTNKFLTPIINWLGGNWTITECAVQRLERPISGVTVGTGTSC